MSDSQPLVKRSAESPGRLGQPASELGKCWSAVGRRLVSALPTLLTLALLGGVGWWGHQHHWQLPAAWRREQPPDDWCAEHSVPESQCALCQPALAPAPPSFGWCPHHGVFDCLWEHPELAQGPSVAPAQRAAWRQQAEQALALARRQENDPHCPLHPRRLQVASPEVLARMGITLASVQQGVVEEMLSAAAEVDYDPDGVANLTSPVAGRLWRIFPTGNVGQAVTAGALLALVDSPAVGQAKVEYLQALGQWELRRQLCARLEQGLREGVVPEGKYREAAAAEREAHLRLLAARLALKSFGLPVTEITESGNSPQDLEQRLHFLGLPLEMWHAAERQRTPAGLLPLQAPLNGVVVSRQARLGAWVEAGSPLFVLADPQHLGVTLHLSLETLRPFRESDPQRLLLGKEVRFLPDGQTGEVRAVVRRVAPTVTDKTRTLTVWATVLEKQARLLPGTFGTARILLRRQEQALLVPADAVHSDGRCQVVFVLETSKSAAAPLIFQVRVVRLGVRSGDRWEVLAGVFPGERLAGSNSQVLRAELLKARLGSHDCACGAP